MIIDDEKAIVQNLIDAGCGEKFIAEFMEKYRNENITGDLKLLQAHRRRLLDYTRLHKEQKRIDCPDYPVYQMTKENSI